MRRSSDEEWLRQITEDAPTPGRPKGAWKHDADMRIEAARVTARESNTERGFTQADERVRAGWHYRPARSQRRFAVRRRRAGR